MLKEVQVKKNKEVNKQTKKRKNTQKKIGKSTILSLFQTLKQDPMRKYIFHVRMSKSHEYYLVSLLNSPANALLPSIATD